MSNYIPLFCVDVINYPWSKFGDDIAKSVKEAPFKYTEPI